MYLCVPFYLYFISVATLEESKSCFYEPIRLFLLHLAAIVLSCVNFFIEKVSEFRQSEKSKEI